MSHLLPIASFLLLLSVTTLAAADHVTESSGSQLSADEAGHPVGFELDIQPFIRLRATRPLPRQTAWTERLSTLFAWLTDFDHAALSQDARGHFFPSSPTKFTSGKRSAVTHGGGKRLRSTATLIERCIGGSTKELLEWRRRLPRESRTGAK